MSARLAEPHALYARYCRPGSAVTEVVVHGPATASPEDIAARAGVSLEGLERRGSASLAGAPASPAAAYWADRSAAVVAALKEIEAPGPGAYASDWRWYDQRRAEATRAAAAAIPLPTEPEPEWVWTPARGFVAVSPRLGVI